MNFKKYEKSFWSLSFWSRKAIEKAIGSIANRTVIATCAACAEWHTEPAEVRSRSELCRSSLFGCAAISSLLLLAACGDDSSSNSSDDSESDRLVESIEEAGACTDANAGEMVKMNATNIDGDTVYLFFICEDGEWVSDIGGSNHTIIKASEVTKDSIKDERDGRTYRTSKVGEQTWIAGNLKYEMEGTLCYENKSENCEKYGRLYSFDAATKACPSDWHLASSNEWKTMLMTLNIPFKRTGTRADTNEFYTWYKPSTMKARYGFDIVPSGYGQDPEYATQNNESQFGNFPRAVHIWAPSDGDLSSDNPKSHQVRIDTKNNIAEVFTADKKLYFTVVCVKD